MFELHFLHLAKLLIHFFYFPFRLRFQEINFLQRRFKSIPSLTQLIGITRSISKHFCSNWFRFFGPFHAGRVGIIINNASKRVKNLRSNPRLDHKFIKSRFENCFWGWNKKSLSSQVLMVACRFTRMMLRDGQALTTEVFHLQRHALRLAMFRKFYFWV